MMEERSPSHVTRSPSGVTTAAPSPTAHALNNSCYLGPNDQQEDADSLRGVPATPSHLLLQVPLRQTPASASLIINNNSNLLNVSGMDGGASVNLDLSMINANVSPTTAPTTTISGHGALLTAAAAPHTRITTTTLKAEPNPRSSIQRRMLAANQLSDESVIIQYLEERLNAANRRQQSQHQATTNSSGTEETNTVPQYSAILRSSPADVAEALAEMEKQRLEAEAALKAIEAMAAEFQSSGFMKATAEKDRSQLRE